MATPFDSIGGLLGIDPEQLKALMAQFAPTEDDRKAANMQALSQLGFGLLGTRKGYEWDQVGNAAQNALQTRQSALQGAQQGKADQFKMAQGLAKYKQEQDAAKQAQVVNSEIGALLQGGGQAQGEGVPAQAKWQIYLMAAEKAALGGNMAQAKHWADLAEKHKPKFSTTPHVGLKDGKAGNFVLDDMGNEKPLGFAPPPKFREMTDNKTTRLVNEYQVPESGMSMPMQTTPGQDQSAALQRAQMAQSERHWQASQGQGGAAKPQLVNGQWVYAPDAQNPTGRAVTPTGMQAPEKPLTESQAKATAFVHQMQNASQTIEELAKEGFDGKTSVQQAQIVAAGTEGIPLVPGSASLPRFAAGPKAQKFYQAELQWTEGALRFMTGANAPKEEVIRNAATYFPRPGDSDAVIAQKNAARKNMEQSIRLAAGAGAAKVPEKAPSNDYDSLPKGAIYTAPDGTKRRKQ